MPNKSSTCAGSCFFFVYTWLLPCCSHGATVLLLLSPWVTNRWSVKSPQGYQRLFWETESKRRSYLCTRLTDWLDFSITLACKGWHHCLSAPTHTHILTACECITIKCGKPSWPPVLVRKYQHAIVRYKHLLAFSSELSHAASFRLLS